MQPGTAKFPAIARGGGCSQDCEYVQHCIFCMITTGNRMFDVNRND
jgi:hypothetical protein